MRLLAGWSVLAVVLMLASPASAQGPRLSVALRESDRGLAASWPEAATHRVAPVEVRGAVTAWPPRPRTYAREGAIIGGVLFGILGFVAGGLDDGDSGGHVSTVGLTVGGAAVGALTGALIGGLFPHSEAKAAQTPSP
jgi:hypothetical protein